MKIGFIGLGKMGLSMAMRLLQHGHEVHGYARRETSITAAKEQGVIGARSLQELVQQLESPKIIWLMVPAGETVDLLVQELTSLLTPGDIVIDGGNSFYKDSIRYAKELNAKRIGFLDVGVSGGVWGLKQGYCLMAGGDETVFRKVEPLLQDLAAKDGYAHVGKNGAGHFAKMIHNGIEYALLQAYAEGFDLLHNKDEFAFDLGKIAKLWNHGSVIRSWILELTEHVLQQTADFRTIAGVIADSGEGRWTAKEAVDLGVATPVITAALLERLSSQHKDDGFSAKIIAMLRKEFGGHDVQKQ